MDKLYVNTSTLPVSNPSERRCPSPNPAMEEQRRRQAKLTELALSMNEAYTQPMLTKGVKVKNPLKSGTSVTFLRSDDSQRASTMIVSDTLAEQVLLCGQDGGRSFQKMLMWKVVPYGVTAVDDDVIAVVLGSTTGRLAGVKTGEPVTTDGGASVRLVSSTSGGVINSWGKELKDWKPRGIALTRQGNVVVTNVHPQASTRLSVYSLDGREVVTFGRSHGPADLSFNTPNHVAVDVFDRVLATDTENNCVKIYDTRGAYVGQFGNIYSLLCSLCHLPSVYFTLLYHLPSCIHCIIKVHSLLNLLLHLRCISFIFLYRLYHVCLHSLGSIASLSLSESVTLSYPLYLLSIPSCNYCTIEVYHLVSIVRFKYTILFPLYN